MLRTKVLHGARFTVRDLDGGAVVLEVQRTAGGGFQDFALGEDEARTLARMLAPRERRTEGGRHERMA